MINGKQHNNDNLSEEIIFQFVSLEKSAVLLTSALMHERAGHNELKDRFQAVQQQKIDQADDLHAARQKVKELEVKTKQLEKNEVLLKEKLRNFKQFSNIVKNPKNADATADLKARLDDYVRYVEETIQLLRDL